jgi:phosphatidylserine/phosphatidylglycerophosphate/cardiolipin synthase-like enzyme
MGAEMRLQPSAPPEPLSKRKAWVHLNKMNTIVIPHDPEDTDASLWACKENEPKNLPPPPQPGGNEVVYLMDGHETLQQFQCEIEKTTGPGDFIYLLGWYLDIDLELPGGGSMRTLLPEKARHGVQVRVMLDGLPHNPIMNSRAVDWLNQEVSQCGDATRPAALRIRGMDPSEGYEDPPLYGDSIRPDSRAAGILDSRYQGVVGCHHQKVLIVYLKQGDQLTAFCGGVDINADRILHTHEKGRPMHDVHCRIRGPAAYNVLKVFCDRWKDWVRAVRPDLPEAERKILGHKILEKILDKSFVPKSCGTFMVQICRTFGCLLMDPFEFAPFGERSIKKLLERAIGASQRFIYIEDQYLIDLDIAKLLKAQLKKIRHLTILIPPGDQILPDSARQQFVDIVKEGGADKVRIFCLVKESNTCNTYIHAKIWVFDDKFAIIDSANCDQRGYTSDSEVSAGIFDPSSDTRLTYTLPHRMRIKLWAHHLGVENDPDGEAELADGVASAGQWFSTWSFKNSRVANFVEQPGWWPAAERKAAAGVFSGVVDPKTD